MSHRLKICSLNPDGVPVDVNVYGYTSGSSGFPQTRGSDYPVGCQGRYHGQSRIQLGDGTARYKAVGRGI